MASAMPDTAMLLTACPHCRRKYRVQAGLVPAQGIRARCPHCGAVFPIVPSVSAARAPGESRIPPGPQPAASGPAWTMKLEEARPAKGAIGEIRPRPPDTNGADEDRMVEEGAAGSTGEPEAHARNLARALVSDLLAYHPEACEEGARSGRLVQLLGGEIAASWELYRREVGDDVAYQAGYFREALNELLARGEDYF